MNRGLSDHDDAPLATTASNLLQMSYEASPHHVPRLPLIVLAVMALITIALFGFWIWSG